MMLLFWIPNLFKNRICCVTIILFGNILNKIYIFIDSRWNWEMVHKRGYARSEKVCSPDEERLWNLKNICKLSIRINCNNIY